MWHLVLQHYMTADWEPASYEAVPYKTSEVNNRNATFNEEARVFINIGLRSLKRVQNPFQMGRFILKKEQVGEYEFVQVVKYYHPIHSADEEIALTYNCDVRRYRYSYQGANAEEANPTFYRSPDSAYDALKGTCQNMTIIICNVMLGEDKPYKVTPANEAKHVPIFVAKV